ncbi:MAG: diacylglycerol kinase family lipid kinase [Desulfitobacterium sp.]|nr:diacylglycerol kinase family lipid kinase [Desulfitobacterium sp.]
MNNNKSWFAVVNPASANGQTRKVWPKLYKRLVQHGVQLDYAFTSHPGEGTDITRQALKDYSQILVVGGDGTLNEVVNGFFANQTLINPNASLAILSHGTGGDFLRSLTQKRGIPSFLDVLKRQQVTPIDCGVVQYQAPSGELEYRYFLNVADVGLSGETVDRVNKRSKVLGGRLSFLIGSLMSLLSYQNKEMKCVLDGKVIVNGTTNSIIVANGRYIGGGMMVAPNAELADGVFDIVVLGDISIWKILRHFPKIYQGKHLDVPGVSFFQGKEISIISNPTAYLDTDGEHPGYTPVHISLLPQCIKLWT